MHFKELICHLRKIPLFRSRGNFLLLIPILMLYVWLNYYHYKPTIYFSELKGERGVELNADNLYSECLDIKDGMRIGDVDGLVATRNKRLQGNMGDKKIIKYWITKNVYTEHLPTEDVCIVEFDAEGLVVHRMFSYIDPD